jgi:hypothetical protein
MGLTSANRYSLLFQCKSASLLESSVRYTLPAAAIGLYCLMPLRITSASPPSVPVAAPATAAPAAPPAPAPIPPAATSDAFAARAAARHAKRTACLKEARAKKLVGAGRNSYVKTCVGP